MRARRSRDLPRGIRIKDGRYEANVGVKGKTRWKRFPIGTALSIVEAWRQEQKKKAAPPAAVINPSTATLADAIAVYLPAKASMPSYKDRVRELADWTRVFGADTPRAEISAVRVQTQMSAWEQAEKSASWINNRKNALANLWTVLDGRRAPNPARDVRDVERPDPEPRGLPYELITAILEAMPDRGQGLKEKERADVSKTKARLEVIAYTGLAHTQIKRLEPSDINWTAGWVFVRSRKKGAAGRAKGRPKPLTPEGLAALKRFADLQAWGPFSNSSMWKSFQRACAALAKDPKHRRRWKKFGIDLTALRPYDLRHSYATTVLESIGSLAELQELMAHADLRTTLRYAHGAVPQHLQTAVNRVRFGGRKSGQKRQKLGVNLVNTKKRSRKHDAETVS